VPVVNIGERQAGRTRGANVIDVQPDSGSILEGIRKAVSPEFRRQASAAPNPYGEGRAAETIVEVLREVRLDRRLLVKVFHDLP
ncbi:MAG: UDP-N-acetylglucosamine 2-epimerase, partial [Fimbriimonadaceae bacterium]|nr:UDP-N-acetylglucosamine 2-epimerase [Fimbriimonadaceae bacterium]